MCILLYLKITTGSFSFHRPCAARPTLAWYAWYLSVISAIRRGVPSIHRVRCHFENSSSLPRAPIFPDVTQKRTSKWNPARKAPFKIRSSIFKLNLQILEIMGVQSLAFHPGLPGNHFCNLGKSGTGK